MLAHKRLQRRAGLLALFALVSVSTTGCFLLWEDDSPSEVTRDFWNAARDGNQEMVEALSVNHFDDMDLDSDDTEIRSISIGSAEIDGDEAEVETLLEGLAEDRELEIEFKTALVKRDGDWFVEMEETTGRLVGAVLGEMASELGEAISEGLAEAMEGFGEELAEGMEELSEALQEAAEDMKEDRDNR
ncbi:MAG: hypothetical protein OEU54_03600 [Gemmatimonadota bacterium]|nr:hypothetical protein [Gemmatimonadota bacterium]